MRSGISADCRVAVLTAERLAAIGSILGGDHQEATLRQRSWKNLLIAQHHDIESAAYWRMPASS